MKNRKRTGLEQAIHVARNSHKWDRGWMLAKIARELRMSNQSNFKLRRQAVSNRLKQDKKLSCKDRTIPTRQQRQHRELKDEETIRYALTNGASALSRKEEAEYERIQ